jgi:hypothetical protein
LESKEASEVKPKRFGSGIPLTRFLGELAIPEANVSMLLHLENFKTVEELERAFKESFAEGKESVALVRGSQIVGTLLSREASEKALARKVAEQFIAHPEAIDELEKSLQEKPEDWS